MLIPVFLFDRPLDAFTSSSCTLACLHVHKEVADRRVIDAIRERNAELEKHVRWNNVAWYGRL